MNSRLNILVVTLFFGAWLFISISPVYAQTEGNAAFVFGYYPNEGQRTLFNEGYQRHLAWHREHADPLPWYGWYVTSGDRLGMFIDGTFGISFVAYDERVDLAEDAADAAQNVSPFSRPVFRRTYVMRPDLSTGSPLKDRQPLPHVQVFFYEIHPGMAEKFEHMVRTVRLALERANEAPIHTWYELVTGGAHPTYMLMVFREDWRSYSSFNETIASVAAQKFDSGKADDLQAMLNQAVAHVRSEVWSYRSDLSYIPNE